MLLAGTLETVILETIHPSRLYSSPQHVVHFQKIRFYSGNEK